MPSMGMDRNNNTTPSSADPTRHIGGKRTPPWEHTAVPRVPYLASSDPPLSSTEKQALPSLWAIRSPSYSTAEEHSAPPMVPVPVRSGSEPWQGHRWNTQASRGDLRATSPPLSEHSHLAPAYERSYEPGMLEKKQSVMALPGTMSSRHDPSKTDTSSKKASCKKQKRNSKKSKDSPPLGQRFTSAVKDLFRKEPLDDSRYETIDERHWSED